MRLRPNGLKGMAARRRLRQTAYVLRSEASDRMSEAWGGCDAKPYLAPGSMLRALVSLLPKIFCFKFLAGATIVTGCLDANIAGLVTRCLTVA